MPLDRIAHPMEGSTVLLFGPQALSFDEEAFRNLRSMILKSKDSDWILDAIAELPNCLNSVTKACPQLVNEPSSKLSLLDDLQNWFATGRTSQTSFTNLPNILLNPLVVIIQLFQYTEYLKIAHSSRRNGGDLYDLSEYDVETLGFCTGFLSALVVSCSRDQDSFEQFGTIAIRLGMLIGMIVDAQNAVDASSPSKSLATIWRSQEDGQKMSDILGEFPEVTPKSPNLDPDTPINPALRPTSLSFTMKTGQP